MSLLRAAYILGTGKVTRAANVWNPKDDLEIKPLLGLQDSESSIFGNLTQRVNSHQKTITFTPHGAWENLAAMFPYLGTVPGTRIFPDVDVPTTVLSRDGFLHTLPATAVFKMPDIFLGVKNTLFGSMEIRALIADGKNPEDDDAIHKIESGQVWAAPAHVEPVHQRYSAAWGAVGGFTAFTAKEGWQISWELTLEPLVDDNYGIVNYIFKSLRAMAKCIPIGPTSAQIEAAVRMQSAGSFMGRSLATNAADLTITGAGGVAPVLHKCQLVESGYVFSQTRLRHGEIGFVTNRTVTAGAVSAVATIA